MMVKKGWLVLVVGFAVAHSRLECPAARSLETGEKVGPCDTKDDDLSIPAHPLQPGLNTVTWVESISHPGAPARFALSLDGVMEGFEECILLDHVPHDECADLGVLFAHVNDPTEEGEHNPQRITLWIPDVKCERCNLQLITFMTDDFHGLPKPGDRCAYSGAQAAGQADASLPSCDVVYHSCAPVSINGTTPRAEHTCKMKDAVDALQWPFPLKSFPNTSEYLFKGDPGLMDEQGRLLSVSAPLDDCTLKTAGFGSGFNCGKPYFDEICTTPTDAPYNQQHGQCQIPFKPQSCPSEDVLGSELTNTPKQTKASCLAYNAATTSTVAPAAEASASTGTEAADTSAASPFTHALPFLAFIFGV